VSSPQKKRPSAEQPKTSIQCSAETERSAVWQNESLDDTPVIVNQRSISPFYRTDEVLTVSPSRQIKP